MLQGASCEAMELAVIASEWRYGLSLVSAEAFRWRLFRRPFLALGADLYLRILSTGRIETFLEVGHAMLPNIKSPAADK